MVETIATPFCPLTLIHVVSVGMFLIVYNSVMEEYASRAFPLALFSRWPLLVRIGLPSIVFAAAHLAVEPFRLEALCTRTLDWAWLNRMGFFPKRAAISAVGRER